MRRHPPGPGTPRQEQTPTRDLVHPGTRYTPWEQTPPQEQTPPRTRYSPPGADTPQTRCISPWSRNPPLGPGTPPDQVQPPGADTPPQDQVHHLGPGTPPRTRYTPPEIRSTRGQSASYWNAILFKSNLVVFTEQLTD